MAQVAAGDVIRSMRAANVEYSTDGSAFTDFSGYAQSVEASGEERDSGEIYTFSGDTPILGYGKLGACEVTINVVYTEDASHVYQFLRNCLEDCTEMYFRWSPLGGDAGEWQWTTGVGIITACPPPSGEANGADPVAVSVTGRFPSASKANVAS